MFAAINAFLTRAVSGYFLNKSLRFRSSASAYLNRTPATATSQTTWTWSAWVKRGALADGTLFSAGVSSLPYATLAFSSNQLIFDCLNSGPTVVGRKYTNALYRDPAAWYHIVAVWDTTNGTAGNRMLLYVNGEQVTSFLYSTNPASSATTQVNSTVAHQIGQFLSAGSYYDGEMAEINFVDGQALAPTAFGAYSTYNQWLPIRYAGTYGTNGFYLPFSTGTDTSSVSVNYLVVAGGGSGGQAGGGGGGYLTGTLSISPSTPYTVTVGAGGVFAGGANRGTNGGNSVFSSITATGGGAGGGNDFDTGANGGSGGGGAYVPGGAGTGVSGQGFAGGTGNNGGSTTYNSGGGGGASGVGGSTTTASVGGNGADGLASSISGTSTYYAGGGGGGAFAVPGTNGLGGGATANRGGGSGTNTNGGSGVVIISYAGAQKFYGGTVTSSGGNTIHTFTASGFLTSVFNDASGNGNNWTPNNISLTAGSTYDSLTDVPTLTSETVANYAVLNPLDSANPALSTNGNLTWTNPATSHLGVRGSIAIPATGAFYIEAINVVANSANAWIGFGLAASTVSLTTNMAGTSANSFNFYSGGNTNAYIYAGTSLLATFAGGAFAASDVVQIAVDVTNTKMWLGKNNVWYSSTGATTGNPTTGANPTFTTSMAGLFLMIEAGGPGGTAAVNMNFGQQPFAYTPPSGFLPLNTYNI